MLVADRERTDAELVGDVRAGNAEAFDRLAERHFGSAYAVAWMRLRDREAAEELAQEVILRAWLNLDRLRDGAAFGGWVARMAHHLAIDWQRRRVRESRLVRMVPMEADVDSIVDRQAKDGRSLAEDSQEKALLDRALAELPRDDRTLVLLHFGQDMGHREIARRLNVHHTTIGRRIDKALENLRRIVDRQAAENAAAAHPLQASSAARMHATALVAAAMMLAPEAKATLVAAAKATAPAAMLAAEASIGATTAATSTAASGVAAGTKIGATIKAVCLSKMVWGVVAAGGVGAGVASWMHTNVGPQATARAEAREAVARADRELPYHAGEQLAFSLGASETVRVRFAEAKGMNLDSVVFEQAEGGGVVAHATHTDGGGDRIDVFPGGDKENATYAMQSGAARSTGGLFFRYFNNEETKAVEMLTFLATKAGDGNVSVSFLANASTDFHDRSNAIFADYFEGRASQRQAAATWCAEAEAAGLMPSDRAHRDALLATTHRWTK